MKEHVRHSFFFVSKTRIMFDAPYLALRSINEPRRDKTGFCICEQ